MGRGLKDIEIEGLVGWTHGCAVRLLDILLVGGVDE